MAPRLEVHIPISPTPMFLRQAWALAASLRRHGGAVGATATVTAWVSPELPGLPDLDRLHPWARSVGLRFRWVDSALFARHWYYGTALARWADSFDADVVLMLDADVLVCASLDALVEQLLASGAVYGLPAHASPLDEAEWRALFASADLPPPRLDHRPSGAGFYVHAREQRMPAYFNLGVIAARADAMATCGRGIVAEMERVNAFIDPALDRARSFFRCQLALALALARQQVDAKALDLRDNFPNDASFEAAHPSAAAAVRLLHYLRQDRGVSKNRDFGSARAYSGLLWRAGLVGTDALLQWRLRALGRCPLDGALQRLRMHWLQPAPQLADPSGFI